MRGLVDLESPLGGETEDVPDAVVQLMAMISFLNGTLLLHLSIGIRHAPLLLILRFHSSASKLPQHTSILGYCSSRALLWRLL